MAVYSRKVIEVTLTEQADDALDESGMLSDLVDDADDYLDDVLDAVIRQIAERYPSVIAKIERVDR